MLLDKITQDYNIAFKSGEKVRAQTLRFLISDIKKFAIDNYPPSSNKSLTDDDVIKILRKQVKNRQESILAFKTGNRQDLVNKEAQELDILKHYLPPEASEEEIKQIVVKTIGTGLTNFGQVMGNVMSQLNHQADGRVVARMVKEELADKV